MQIISRDNLKRGGFAGLTETRIVTDSRVFAGRKDPQASEGLGSFVYLADANFNPHGETGMHPHMEIDVISVMLEGQVSHEGSLEHGQELNAGQVQVQRAGGEGFSHNEINPDDKPNRMIQIWALPEKPGQRAEYKLYQPDQQVTRIYGGDAEQNDTFASSTVIDIIQLAKGEEFQCEGEYLSYVTAGQVNFIENEQSITARDGDLIRGHTALVKAEENTHIIVVHLANQYLTCLFF